MQPKIEQFRQQISAVDIDYTIIADNNIVKEIKEAVVKPVSSWSDTCHADCHFEHGGHMDSHSDSHPDCAHSNEILGQS